MGEVLIIFQASALEQVDEDKKMVDARIASLLCTTDMSDGYAPMNVSAIDRNVQYAGLSTQDIVFGRAKVH